MEDEMDQYIRVRDQHIHAMPDIVWLQYKRNASTILNYTERMNGPMNSKEKMALFDAIMKLKYMQTNLKNISSPA
jgi:hypothetical protein